METISKNHIAKKKTTTIFLRSTTGYSGTIYTKNIVCWDTIQGVCQYWHVYREKWLFRRKFLDVSNYLESFKKKWQKKQPTGAKHFLVLHFLVLHFLSFHLLWLMNLKHFWLFLSHGNTSPTSGSFKCLTAKRMYVSLCGSSNISIMSSRAATLHTHAPNHGVANNSNHLISRTRSLSDFMSWSSCVTWGHARINRLCRRPQGQFKPKVSAARLRRVAKPRENNPLPSYSKWFPSGGVLMGSWQHLKMATTQKVLCRVAKK